MRSPGTCKIPLSNHDSRLVEKTNHLWSSWLGGYVGESHGYPRMTGWFGARYSKKVISSVCLSLKIIVTGEVWWETSHKTDSSKEVTLKQVGNGMDLKSRVLARLEFMKFASAPESTNTACDLLRWEKRRLLRVERKISCSAFSSPVSSPLLVRPDLLLDTIVIDDQNDHNVDRVPLEVSELVSQLMSGSTDLHGFTLGNLSPSYGWFGGWSNHRFILITLLKLSPISKEIDWSLILGDKPLSKSSVNVELFQPLLVAGPVLVRET